MFLLNSHRFSLWTPAELTTTIWLDASDESTITLNGSNVSQWDDKSGNNRNAVQEAAGSQPIYVSRGQNGLNVINTATNRYLACTTGSYAQPITVYAIGKSSALDAALINLHTASSVAPLRLGNGQKGYFTSEFNVYYGADNTPNLSVSSYTIMGATNNGTTTYPYHNGTAQNTRSESMPSADRFTIGRHGNTTHWWWNGYVAEIIIASSILSTNDRQKLEGYLAHKWGLESNLPAGHPYKSNPPGIV